MTRQTVIETTKEFSYEEERAIFLDKIKQGLEQADKGQTITHTKVEATLKKKWLK